MGSSTTSSRRRPSTSCSVNGLALRRRGHVNWPQLPAVLTPYTIRFLVRGCSSSAPSKKVRPASWRSFGVHRHRHRLRHAKYASDTTNARWPGLACRIRERRSSRCADARARRDIWSTITRSDIEPAYSYWGFVAALAVRRSGPQCTDVAKRIVAELGGLNQSVGVTQDRDGPAGDRRARWQALPGEPCQVESARRMDPVCRSHFQLGGRGPRRDGAQHQAWRPTATVDVDQRQRTPLVRRCRRRVRPRRRAGHGEGPRRGWGDDHSEHGERDRAHHPGHRAHRGDRSRDRARRGRRRRPCPKRLAARALSQSRRSGALRARQVGAAPRRRSRSARPSRATEPTPWVAADRA